VVTRAQLDRLGSRIEALAPPRTGARFAVILVNSGESETEAEERHYRLHPDDRQAAKTILVVFMAPKKDRAAEGGP
jgi:hypothetical protein